MDTNILFHVEQRRKANRTSDWLRHIAEFDTMTFKVTRLDCTWY